MRRAILVAAVTLLAVSGCGQYAAPNPPALPPHRGELLGTWVHEDQDSSAGATLTLNDDGTLRFSGIPSEVLSGDGASWIYSADLRSGSGTWEYDEGQTVFSRLQVEFEFDEFGDTQLDLSSAVAGGVPQLVFVIGDLEDGNFYRLTHDI